MRLLEKKKKDFFFIIWVVRFQFVDQAQICLPINNQK